MDNNFSEMVKGLRKQRRWTQAQMAHELSVDAVTVSRWERGQSRPSWLAMRQLQRLNKKLSEEVTNDNRRSD